LRLTGTQPALSIRVPVAPSLASYSAGFVVSEYAPVSRLILALAAAVQFFVVSTALESAASGIPTTQNDLVVVQAPVVRPGLPSQRFPQGSRMISLTTPGHAPVTLTPDFLAVADPRVSFDGRRILLSGKKSPEATWQIWEMEASGAHARQITHCATDCVQPAYLPRGEIAFTAVTGRTADDSQVWVSKSDGADAHPITFGPGGYQAEAVLQNGTILVSANSPLRPSSGQPVDRQIYTIRPDGTGLATLRCDHGHAAIRSQAQELPDGSVVFVKSPLRSAGTGGELAWIRRGALHNAPLTSPGVSALSPQPLTGSEIVVSRPEVTTRPTPSKLALYAFNTEQRQFDGLIYRDPKLLSIAAVPVAAHEPPRWYWSTLNPQLKVGYFICIDAYLAQGVPHDRLSEMLSRVRVWRLDPETQHETELGQAPVEPDGSFYIAVPQDQPVRFELLDEAGKVVRAQRSWIWSRSGEEHGCVGCHEDRARAPENRWPQALRRMEGPYRLGVEKAAGRGQ